jgi:tRNA (cmo5U34)-methyltransferase
MSEIDKIKTDNIYANQLDKIESFSFNQKVVDVFPDMISRSVPGYNAIVSGIAELATLFVQPNTHIYDLGCSLGAVTLAIAKSTRELPARIIGVDNSSAMVKRCTEKISAFSYANNVEIIEGDINDIECKDASFVVLNFTLQFIEPDKRQALINRLYQSLNPGGVLIVSEKLKHHDPRLNEAIVHMHHNFKRNNGYSDLEIAQKRSALEKVMLLDTQHTHQQRFEEAGFASSSLWFQQLNFASFMAIKD